MKRAILMSIQPQWIEKILNREKLIEIRKTMPKCELPIDVYLYCTKAKLFLYGYYGESDDAEGFGYATSYCPTEDINVLDRTENLNGKVVAKFTLNETEKHFNAKYFGFNPKFLNDCQLANKDIDNYVGIDKTFYAWHIDNLQIFDKPMELSDFHKPCICPKMQYCPSCPKGYVYMSEDEEEYYRATNGQEGCETEWVCLNVVEKAPQSWQYVEVKE